MLQQRLPDESPPQSPSSTTRPFDDRLSSDAATGCPDDDFSGDEDEDLEQVMPNEDAKACAVREVRELRVAAHFSGEELGTADVVWPGHEFNQLPWQIGDELLGADGVAAPNYFTVCFADRIPEETGAAKVNLSRLETGPQWRDFLQYRDPDTGLAIDAMLECPCCLGILRRPVGLPCGHSLCRGCLTRLPFSAAGVRNCPLCRAAILHTHLRVNEPLDAVTEALHALRAGPAKAEAKERNFGSLASALCSGHPGNVVSARGVGASSATRRFS
mmetsp:Transcript_22430/g.40007  ORF Transcript_22430/g.40007 Transcript_22430/m.40007 type:complete len:273 (-) Transcript_22430:11-829(-)